MREQTRPSRRLIPVTSVSLFVTGLTGCARSPDFNVLGSYFPGWLVCMMVGVAFTAVVHTVLNRLELEGRVAALPLFYVSLALLSACVCWLIVFE